MASAARSASVDLREEELQDAVRKDALEVLSMQIDVEAEQMRGASRRDSTWAIGLLGLAIGAGVRSRLPRPRRA